MFKSSTNDQKQQELSNQNNNSNEYEIPIGENYRLNAKNKLGSGAFGDIYQGTNLKLNELVAIKLEPVKAKHPQLFSESKMIMALQGGSKTTNCNYFIFSWHS